MDKRQATVVADPFAHRGKKKSSVKKDAKARKVASPQAAGERQSRAFENLGICSRQMYKTEAERFSSVASCKQQG